MKKLVPRDYKILITLLLFFLSIVVYKKSLYSGNLLPIGYGVVWSEVYDVPFTLNGTLLYVNPKAARDFNEAVFLERFKNFEVNPYPCNKTIKFRGSRVELGETLWVFNSDCFRGSREYSIEKPENVYRIVLLGDSFVFGDGLNESQTLAAQLEQKLNSKGTEKTFEVLNLAVGAYNTHLEVSRFERLGLKYKPDIVIIGYHPNDYVDARLDYLLNFYLISYLSGKNLTREQVWKYKSMISPSRILPFNTSFSYSVVEPLKKLSNLSKNHGFQVIIFSYPLGGVLSEKEYLKKIEEIAKAESIPFFYLPVEIGYKYRDEWLVHPEDPHPSEYANKRLAEFLAKKVISIM